MTALVRAGAGLCAEPKCVMKSRVITPEMELHLSHDPTGTIVLGLSHARCNQTEAAKRARKLQGRNSGRAARRTPERSHLTW